MRAASQGAGRVWEGRGKGVGRAQEGRGKGIGRPQEGTGRTRVAFRVFLHILVYIKLLIIGTVKCRYTNYWHCMAKEINVVLYFFATP